MFIFTFFILTVIIIVAIGHIPVYFLVKKILKIRISKFLLMFLLLLLSVSFLLSSVLIHFDDNLFTKIFYISSMLWHGTVGNLLFIMPFGLVFYKLFKKRFNLKLFNVGVAIVVLTLIVSVVGIVNSRYPTVKTVSINIENLPEAWRHKKVLLISDVHIGVINGEIFVERMVKKINEQKPDILFITGDLFDGSGDNINKAVKPLKKLNNNIKTFYVIGNHEIYLGYEKTSKALAGINIEMLNDEITELDGVQIVGLVYREKNSGQEASNVLEKLDPSKPSIVLVHSPKYVYGIKQNVDLQLSGHTHRGQLFPFNLITHIIFKGNDYGLHTNDNLNIYTTSGVGTWGPPMRTTGRPEIVNLEFK